MFLHVKGKLFVYCSNHITCKVSFRICQISPVIFEFWRCLGCWCPVEMYFPYIEQVVAIRIHILSESFSHFCVVQICVQQVVWSPCIWRNFVWKACNVEVRLFMWSLDFSSFLFPMMHLTSLLLIQYKERIHLKAIINTNGIRWLFVWEHIESYVDIPSENNK